LNSYDGFYFAKNNEFCWPIKQGMKCVPVHECDPVNSYFIGLDLGNRSVKGLTDCRPHSGNNQEEKNN
jgi:hypothetical protein